MKSNPTQQIPSVEAELESLPLKFRKFSGDSAITTDSESWESDVDGDSLVGVENEENPEESPNIPRLSLDSGLAGQVVKRSPSAAQLQQLASERKFKSILRAEPQVFKVNEAKVRKSKSKKTTDNSASSDKPRKAVGFILPDGVKIPERAPSVRKLPVHFRAQKTLRVLKQKLKGNSSTTHVPWRASAHTLGKVQAPTAPNVIRARQIQVDEKIDVREPVIVKVTKYGDLKVKKLKVSEIETEEGLIIEEEEDLDSGENSEQEDQADSGLNETDNEEDAPLKFGKVTEKAMSKKKENEVDISNDADKEEEDANFNISRRKALRYHLKGIQVNGDKDVKPKATSVKKAPKFPTAGHGPGHAQKHYPRAPAKHVVMPAEVVEKTKAITTVKKQKSSPFRLIHRKHSIEITDPGDTVIAVDNNNKEEVKVKPPKKPESTTPKVQTQFEYLLNIARLIEPVPGTKTKPGKIVNTRYRRVPSYEHFPHLV